MSVVQPRLGPAGVARATKHAVCQPETGRHWDQERVRDGVIGFRDGVIGFRKRVIGFKDGVIGFHLQASRYLVLCPRASLPKKKRNNSTQKPSKESLED